MEVPKLPAFFVECASDAMCNGEGVAFDPLAVPGALWRFSTGGKCCLRGRMVLMMTGMS